VSILFSPLHDKSTNGRHIATSVADLHTIDDTPMPSVFHNDREFFGIVRPVCLEYASRLCHSISFVCGPRRFDVPPRALVIHSFIPLHNLLFYLKT
jgi:hypothetical protein